MRLTQLPLFVFACLAVGCGRANVVAAEVEAAQAYTEPPEPPRPPYTDICVRAQASRIPVLMFHDVTATRGHDSVWFDVTVDEFKAMVDRFVEDRIQPISLEQLYAHLTRGAPVPEKAIVLTFDDNYQGVYDHALPILKATNFPAAVFVHTNYVGSHDNRPKMDWPTLKEIVEGGLITIGSHTLSHPDDITQIPPSQQEREIVDSKRILEEHLGKTIDTFAYPEGKNDSAT
ncbi:MAG: polysaccharide deacetylase family protein, partial [Fimbriimonas ginsengisoli]|nr:polysaccharide deacetylase family protein [Fimbriimonas ginsengisoli]